MTLIPTDEAISEGWGDEEQPYSGQADWLHLSPGDVVNVRVLSQTPTRYYAHWAGDLRRFVKCEGPRCARCVLRLPQRKHFVLAVLDDDERQWVWEFGELQAQQVRVLLPAGAELRGLALRLVRPPARGNPPVLVHSGEPGAGTNLLPEPVDVAGILSAVWLRAAFAQGKAKQQPVLNLDAARVSRRDQGPQLSQPASDAPGGSTFERDLARYREQRQRPK